MFNATFIMKHAKNNRCNIVNYQLLKYMSVRPIFLPYPGARLKFFFFPILRPATEANRGREGLKPPYDSLARISLWSPFSNFTHVLWYIRPN
jgi:hypothetical protein